MSKIMVIEMCTINGITIKPFHTITTSVPGSKYSCPTSTIQATRRGDDLGTTRGLVVNGKPRPHFTPKERIPSTHWMGGWVGLRAGLDTQAKGKILCLCQGLNPGRPGCSQILYWLTYPSMSVNNLQNSLILKQKITWVAVLIFTTKRISKNLRIMRNFQN
jgi:hypothetical protein